MSIGNGTRVQVRKLQFTLDFNLRASVIGKGPGNGALIKPNAWGISEQKILGGHFFFFFFTSI